MISVGIFTGYYPDTVDGTIAKIKEGGFSCVQLDISFKDCDAAKEPLTKEKARLIRNKLRDANLPVIAVSAYTNLVHPNPEKRRANIAYFKNIMEYAVELGCPYVASETGTYNTGSDWVWHEDNATEAAYQDACEVIWDVVKFGQKVGAAFIVENYVNNVIGSIEQVQRLFKDIGAPNIGLICDPTNYFTEKNIEDMDGELHRIFNALGTRMIIAHAKDCKLAADTGEKHADIDAKADKTFRGSGGVELPAAGMGVLNYELYLKLLARDWPNIPLVIEHLDEGGIPRAKRFVDGVLKRVGV